MGDVHILPGVFRSDLEESLDPVAVLQSALASPLRDVAIVGRGIDGSLTIWGSHDADISIALLTRGANWLARAEQEAVPPEQGEPA